MDFSHGKRDYWPLCFAGIQSCKLQLLEFFSKLYPRCKGHFPGEQRSLQPQMSSRGSTHGGTSEEALGVWHYLQRPKRSSDLKIQSSSSRTLAVHWDVDVLQHLLDSGPNLLDWLLAKNRNIPCLWYRQGNHWEVGYALTEQKGSCHEPRRSEDPRNAATKRNAAHPHNVLAQTTAGQKNWLGGSSHKTHWLTPFSRRNNHCLQHYGLGSFLLTKDKETIKCAPLLTYGKVSCSNENYCYLLPHLQKIATG